MLCVVVNAPWGMCHSSLGNLGKINSNAIRFFGVMAQVWTLAFSSSPPVSYPLLVLSPLKLQLLLSLRTDVHRVSGLGLCLVPHIIHFLKTRCLFLQSAQWINQISKATTRALLMKLPHQFHISHLCLIYSLLWLYSLGGKASDLHN